MFVDNRNELINQFNITCKKGMEYKKLVELFKKIKNLAFNNSEFKGKCIKVKLREGRFRGIEIILGKSLKYFGISQRFGSKHINSHMFRSI